MSPFLFATPLYSKGRAEDRSSYWIGDLIGEGTCTCFLRGTPSFPSCLGDSGCKVIALFLADAQERWKSSDSLIELPITAESSSCPREDMEIIRSLALGSRGQLNNDRL